MTRKLPLLISAFAVFLLCTGLSVALAALLQEEMTPEDTAVRYAAFNTALYLSPEETSSENKINVAAEVVVLAEEGDWVQIELNGWQQDGVPTLMYAYQGLRIRMAYLTEAAQAQLETLDTVYDENTELTWHQIRLAAWVKAADLVLSREEMFAEANKYLTTYCTICHTVRDPHHYSANSWPSQMEAMGIYVPLTPEQKDLLLKYLQYNASEFAPAEEAESEA